MINKKAGWLLGVLALILVIFFGAFYLFEFAGLKYYIRAVQKINSVPLVDKPLVSENFFGDKKETKIYKGILEVTNNLDLPIRKLSLGQRLKMELIGAIMHNPEVVFLDEPTLGLDVVAKRNIREFLRKINKEKGVTIILTSHDMADIEKVCDRVIVINHGKIMFDDAIGKLTSRYRDRKYLTLIFTEEVAEEEVEKYGRVIDKKPLTYTIEVAGKDQSRVIAEVSEKLPIDDIDITHVPLDEIMADMFKRG